MQGMTMMMNLKTKKKMKIKLISFFKNQKNKSQKTFLSTCNLNQLTLTTSEDERSMINSMRMFKVKKLIGLYKKFGLLILFIKLDDLNVFNLLLFS
jgi:hypothetical protein